jgi:dipeptidyl aminopeptidase/acylaminoacyl peptidase
MKTNFQVTILTALCLTLIACSSTDTVSTLSNQVNKTTQKPLIPEVSVATQPSQTEELTLKQIMADPDWMGRPPQYSFWHVDGKSVLYWQKREGQTINDLWQVEADQNRLVPLSELHQFDHSDKITNHERTQLAWVFEGDVFHYDHAKQQVTQLTQDQPNPHNLRFLNDGRLAFQLHNSMIALDIQTGYRERLVQWQFEAAPKANAEPKDFIAREQQALIEVVALKRKQNQQKFVHQQQLKKANPSSHFPNFYLDPKHVTVEASLSPNGRWLIVSTTQDTEFSDESDIMPDYIGEDGRIKTQQVRKRVADAKPVNETLWLMDLHKQRKQKLSYTSLPGYNDDVLAAVKQENAQAKGQTYQINRLPRAIGLINSYYWSQSRIQWYQDGDNVAIMLEAWDNKDRWIATVDFAKSKLVSQHRLHDEAWINYEFNSFGWLNHSPQLYYLSEESGYAQLYIKPLKGEARALTQGKFEVDELTLTQDDQYFYFRANRSHPGIYEIYRVAVESAKIDKLTELEGDTHYRLSTDEQQLLLEHSKINRPPELYLQAAVPASEATQITQTVSEAFLSIEWNVPQIVPIPSSHVDEPVYSRVYLPKDNQQQDPRKAVVFSHGAGYLQNAHLGWSGYFREFMFHTLLTQRGYVVLDMDYRASAGYGRDWRTAIYRQMGTPEVEDLRDGVNWLVKNVNVDPERVGTYGGSYGGFMTFMAMFNEPDLFAAGAALRPVTDWAHYNTAYTSNILNTPQDDPIAYRRSSPIYFAEGLSKPLLINAPMVDSNVFFVDVVRLVQRLIELEKVDFETAIYPVESHGFVQPSSWLDEYRRIFKLFEENL